MEEQAEKAFFDSLAVELSREPPAMGRIMLLLSDVRDQLLRLCEPSGGPLAQTTSGRLSGLAAQIRERMEEGYMKQR